MVGDRYRVEADDACYAGSDVLINLPDLRDPAALEEFEVEAVGRRSLEALPAGAFDTAHYRALHRHLFGDVYAWAGDYRTVVTWKGSSRFAQPTFIRDQMETAFARLLGAPFLPGGDPDAFIVEAAEFLGDVNHIHPFREGNGRTQLIFMRLLGQRAGHPFRSQNVEAEPFLRAMIESFHGRMEALIDELERMLA
jgi:cell filamentation protein